MFQKILIPMVLEVVVFAVTILSCILYMFENAQEKRICEENNNVATSISANVEGFMNKAYKIRKELANNQSILSMETEVQTPTLAGTTSRNDYLELYIYRI